MIRLGALAWQDWTALALWLALAIIFTPYSIAHAGCRLVDSVHEDRGRHLGGGDSADYPGVFAVAGFKGAVN